MQSDRVSVEYASSGAQTGASGDDGIDRGFWENELETSLQRPLAEAGTPQRMAGWVKKLSPRQRAVLCAGLGLEADKAKEQRTALEACNGGLTPFYLVDQFAYRKSKFAVADLATRVLPPEQVKACRLKGDDYDVRALLYALYVADPDYLRMVFHHYCPIISQIVATG